MVNNSIIINKTKESLNSDGQQFHQYQLNKRPVPLNKGVVGLSFSNYNGGLKKIIE
jgi:hypothetical protein